LGSEAEEAEAGLGQDRAAVLLDVEYYEAMMDELALLRDVREAEEQVAAGKSLSHESVARRLRARLAR